jgi:glycosyltransferase involved in cell wall biosynthesis
VISTARQENFGISVVEAVRHGCFPLLPRNLSYPELIPQEFHDEVLYRDRNELVEKLSRLLVRLPLPDSCLHDRLRRLARSMNRFSWETMIPRYDAELERLCEIAPEPGQLDC